jgi:hypothetical protein
MDARTMRPDSSLLGRNDRTEIAMALIERGADVNAKSGYGYTSLLWASQNGLRGRRGPPHREGADINAMNKDGDTALHTHAGHFIMHGSHGQRAEYGYKGQCSTALILACNYAHPAFHGSHAGGRNGCNEQ